MLPFIEIVKLYCKLINLNLRIDYRKLTYPIDGNLFYHFKNNKNEFEEFEYYSGHSQPKNLNVHERSNACYHTLSFMTIKRE